MRTIPPEVSAGAGATCSEELDRLAPEGRIGLAVSGGPDSLALLLLVAGARPGGFEVATVDHALRPDSAEEAAQVRDLCERLGAPHTVLRVAVASGASVQAHAREARYAALAAWGRERGLVAVATGHHRDDQAETLLMRLARGSGIGGLSAMRSARPLAHGVRLIRPLLGLGKAELMGVVEAAGLVAADDPSNRDERHDRTRVRQLLGAADWLRPERLARSAEALGEAEDALSWSAERLSGERIAVRGEVVTMAAGDLPPEFQRRLLRIGFERLGHPVPPGPETDRALATLRRGDICTLGEVKLSGGTVWTLSPTPPRRA